ncbi:MAG: hypothetical protein R2845_08565 [Thermomicrobiales bacterium]
MLDRIGRTKYKVQKTGSVRRWEETVDDVNLITTAPLGLIAEHAADVGIENPVVESYAVTGTWLGEHSGRCDRSSSETWGTDLLRGRPALWRISTSSAKERRNRSRPRKRCTRRSDCRISVQSFDRDSRTR